MLAQDNLPNNFERKEAFRSRIAVIGHLDPLSFEDMCGMIGHRLKTAGGGQVDKYFEPPALIEIYNTTRGVPRDICMLCDACFVNGFVRDQRVMSAALVERTVSEMSREKGWPVRDGKEHKK